MCVSSRAPLPYPLHLTQLAPPPCHSSTLLPRVLRQISRALSELKLYLPRCWLLCTAHLLHWKVSSLQGSPVPRAERLLGQYSWVSEWVAAHSQPRTVVRLDVLRDRNEILAPTRPGASRPELLLPPPRCCSPFCRSAFSAPSFRADSPATESQSHRIKSQTLPGLSSHPPGPHDSFQPLSSSHLGLFSIPQRSMCAHLWILEYCGPSSWSNCPLQPPPGYPLPVPARVRWPVVLPHHSLCSQPLSMEAPQQQRWYLSVHCIP